MLHSWPSQPVWTIIHSWHFCRCAVLEIRGEKYQESQVQLGNAISSHSSATNYSFGKFGLFLWDFILINRVYKISTPFLELDAKSVLHVQDEASSRLACPWGNRQQRTVLVILLTSYNQTSRCVAGMLLERLGMKSTRLRCFPSRLLLCSPTQVLLFSLRCEFGLAQLRCPLLISYGTNQEFEVEKEKARKHRS